MLEASARSHRCRIKSIRDVNPSVCSPRTQLDSINVDMNANE